MEKEKDSQSKSYFVCKHVKQRTIEGVIFPFGTAKLQTIFYNIWREYIKKALIIKR